MNELVNLLKEKNITLSSCESFTGGLFAATLTSIAGVSHVYKGSIIAYHNEVKKNVLNISEHIFTEFGVVSARMALEMAIKTNVLFKTDVCVSFTGNAGPSSLEGKNVGLWYLAIQYKEQSFVYQFNISGSRKAIRKDAVKKAEEFILHIIRTN